MRWSRSSPPRRRTRAPASGSRWPRVSPSRAAGALAIESELGRGTTVAIWLPVAGAREEVAQVQPGAAPVAGLARRVLVVDDEELVRETLVASLEDAGFAVLAVGNGAEALALLEAEEPVDVLVSDLSMPGMDGLALIREAHVRRPGLRGAADRLRGRGRPSCGQRCATRRFRAPAQAGQRRPARGSHRNGARRRGQIGGMKTTTVAVSDDRAGCGARSVAGNPSKSVDAIPSSNTPLSTRFETAASRHRGSAGWKRRGWRRHSCTPRPPPGPTLPECRPPRPARCRPCLPFPAALPARAPATDRQRSEPGVKSSAVRILSGNLIPSENIQSVRELRFSSTVSSAIAMALDAIPALWHKMPYEGGRDLPQQAGHQLC